MYIKNIRELKKNLRAQYRRSRESMDPREKAGMDSAILGRMLSVREYVDCRFLLTYVGKQIEVDTIGLIRAALAQGKRVGVPLCRPEVCGMEFYEIRSTDSLREGTYGVLEPEPSPGGPILQGHGELCVVPGLSFDPQGYRLGYGKGYYDRFLADYAGITVGLCYSDCVCRNLPHGFYDRPVDILITDKYIRRIRKN